MVNTLLAVDALQSFLVVVLNDVHQQLQQSLNLFYK